MDLSKQEVNKLLNGELTKGRSATAEEKRILQVELMKLIQMYKETNKREMLEEMTSLVNTLHKFEIKVVAEDQGLIQFVVEPFSGSVSETFNFRVADDYYNNFWRCNYL